MAKSDLDMTVKVDLRPGIQAMRDMAAEYRILADHYETTADRLSEKQARRTGNCDGNHARPVCPDPGCWILDHYPELREEYE